MRLAGALLLAGLLLGTPASLRAQHRVAGEYGLRVAEREGEIRVGWLTQEAARGVLEVYRGGERIHRFETGVGQGHSASFPRPDHGPAGRDHPAARGGAPRGPVTLRYGELGSGGSEKEDGGLHATTLYLDGEGRPPAGVLAGVDSLFVVGDVHGEYDTLLRLLRNAGLVDADGRWSGARAHVVFLGDLFDRGPDVTRTLWFLYRLEREAAAAGGGAHVVLGNHETMIFTDDLRYVAPKEKLLAFLHGTTYPRLFDIRESVLGRWLASRPGLMRVDGALLAHGGVAPAYAEYGVEELNDSLRTFLGEDFFYYLDAIFDPADTTAALVLDPELADRVRAERVIVMDSAAAQRRLDFFFADSSVFWFRDYVRTDTLGAELEEVLDHHGACVHVVAHTPVTPIQARMGGRLIAVDLEEPATEILLLVRNDDGSYERWRYGLEGPPEPVEVMAAPAADPVAPPDTTGRSPPGHGTVSVFDPCLER